MRITTIATTRLRTNKPPEENEKKKKRKPNGYLGYLPNAVPKTQKANNQKTKLNSKRKSQENNRNNKTRPKSAPPNISSDAQPQSNSLKP